MFCYIGYRGWRPRLRSQSTGKESKTSKRLDLREKRKRNISEPIPIVKSTAAVERMLRFHDNNNMFLLTDGSSISESPCHRGYNRQFCSETSSTTTGYANSEDDDSVFVDQLIESSKIEPAFPQKPPRMKQKREFVCQNQNCNKREVLLGKVQVLFKSCNFCFTHYCSARCQNISWKEHKNVCFYGNIDSNLSQIETILEQPEVSIYFSKLAFDGYKFKGRGCLFITFSSPKALVEFVEHTIAGIRFRPTYSATMDVLKRCVSNRYRRQLVDTIGYYEPATQYVINVAVVVGHRVPNNPVPRTREVTVRKILTAHLHPDFTAREKQLSTLKECQTFSPTRKLKLQAKNSRRKSV